MKFTPIASSSAGNAYLVEEAGLAPLLIDPGIRFGALLPALNYGTEALAGCLVSHQHGDHAKSAAALAQRGVPIYTSRECAKALGIDGHIVFHVDHGRVIAAEGWQVMAWDAVHDVRCLGFTIQSPSGDRLLYCTDSACVPVMFPLLTHIAIGVNYEESIIDDRVASGRMGAALSSRVKSSHMSLAAALEFFKANDLSALREVHLLHLSAGNSNEADFKTAVQRVAGVPVFVAGA